MSNHEIRMKLVEVDLDRDLGIRTPSPDLARIFRDVGFDSVDADRGARLMERSPFGFSAIATELATLRGSAVIEAVSRQIAKGQAAVDERARARVGSGRTPWRRSAVEESARTPWGSARHSKRLSEPGTAKTGTSGSASSKSGAGK